MAIPISELRRVRDMGPPRVLIYGPPGAGKTTLASEFPDHICLQVEDGKPADVELNSWGLLSSFNEVIDQLGELYNAEHDLKTLIVDSVTELQRHVHAETCARGDDKGNAKASIEDFGYGKGYVYAQRVWQEFIDGLNALRRDKGMAIVLIAHSKIERFDDPESVSYDRYEIDLHTKSVGMIEREMDAILLLKSPVTIKEEKSGFDKKRAIAGGRGSNIVIHAVGRPAYVAKNRYGIPETVPFIRGHGFTALAPYFQGSASAVAQAAE